MIEGSYEYSNHASLAEYCVVDGIEVVTEVRILLGDRLVGAPFLERRINVLVTDLKHGFGI